MHWIVNLDGGPRRVNHAAVAIDDKIYSFGGYSAREATYRGENELIDIHMLNTYTYRWQRIPSQLEIEFQKRVKPRSRTIASDTPSSSSSSNGSASPDSASRRRSETFSELHPLDQLRQVRPPLELSSTGITTSPSNQNPVADESVSPAANFFMDIWAEVDELQGSHMEDEEVGIEEEEESFPIDSWNNNNNSNNNNNNRNYEFERFLINNVMNWHNDLGVAVGNNRDTGGHLHFAGVPTQRYGHTVVAYRGKAYLWGGRNDKYGCSTLLHEYDPSTNNWRVVPTTGIPPPSRDGHSAVVFNDTMYIFGGFEEPFHRFSQETYAFHFPTCYWSRVNTEGEPPLYRDFHAATILDGRMYVFGGRSDEAGQFHSNKDIYCNKLKYLDLNQKRKDGNVYQWHDISIKGNKRPCGRRSLTMWTLGSALYIFGGYQSNMDTHFNDIYRFDPILSEWTHLEPCGPAPLPRRRQCTIVVGSRVFLFGGTMPNPKRPNTLEDLGDLHVLDFEPSLCALAANVIIKSGLLELPEVDFLLPKVLRNELNYMVMPNKLSKSVDSRSFIGTG